MSESKGVHSLRTQLRILFEANLRYSIEDLHSITGAPKDTIRSTVSVLKHPKHSGRYGAIELNIIQSPTDRVKRWGLPSAEGNYQP